MTPAWATSAIPGKGLVAIKPQYVIDELNKIGTWSYKIKQSQLVDGVPVVLIRFKMTIGDVTVKRDQYGGSKNSDMGDAFKGAVTDALSKIAAQFGVCHDIWTNNYRTPETIVLNSPLFNEIKDKLTKGEITYQEVKNRYWITNELVQKQLSTI